MPMPSTTFDGMATLASERVTPSPPFHRRRKSWARRVERYCCATLTHFPLLFVYGLTSWAVYVHVNVSFLDDKRWLAYPTAILGVVLYTLANVSYTTAVFTNPGSPLDPREDLSKKSRRTAGYQGLPMHDGDGTAPAPEDMTTVTAKSTGKPRYCKKCRTVKPDRAHHCSSCGRCVLKMDHHCPWLATCVGLRNYKPFLLFLIYTCIFCWLCFLSSASWVWLAIVDDARLEESMLIVNTIILAVLGGIIGLVLSGFTGWHIYLALTGQTTIESLEKTRYLSPLRKSMENQLRPERNYTDQGSNREGQSLLEQLKETHANALPGVLRPEEGEDTHSQSATPIPQVAFQPSSGSPAKDSLQRSYASLEEQRDRERYDAYLDEQDSEKLPNAFDMGWKRNVLHVFGDKPLLWLLPVRNTSGDGWMWEVSPKWTEAQREVAQQRQARQRDHSQWDHRHPGFVPPRHNVRWTPGQGFVGGTPPPPSNRFPGGYMNGGDPGNANMQMQPLDRRKTDDIDSYDTSSDEDNRDRESKNRAKNKSGGTANWNDIPDDLLAAGANGRSSRSRSRGRHKGD